MLKYIVFGILQNEPLTGYDIKKLIQNGAGVFYKASYGSLYPLLSKETENGNLEVSNENKGNRIKKLYKLTEQGKLDFNNWLGSPIDIEDSLDKHLAKIYFFDKLPQNFREQQLIEYENRNISYLKELETLWEKFNSMDNKDCFYYKLTTLCYGICTTQQTIKWCKHIREHKNLEDLFEEV